ncbi:LysR family transcriptional regulator [Cupriavidus metallidurans]|uniref:LysR family transcriptional regulator n=1 Tax=Cupriavidus metallidurans TaxID=119219 RepID=UPI0004676412|nr:LysR family transcriptional regulator [Cupriavidus metallidurans]
MRLLQELDIFVRPADNGSLSATARALDLTPAATSAALKRLEGELGVQLFVRSTRTMRLTREGEQYLAQCRPALEVLQQASRDLVTGNQAFQGVVRLSAPSDFGRNLLLPWLDAFQDRHPLVEFRLQLTDRMANIYSDPVDVAFRYGDPPDSNLVAVPVATGIHRVLCASPGYLASHDMPQTPYDLSAHRCLCYMFGDDVHDRWRFAREDGETLTVRVKPANVSNDGDAVRRWALAGKGIAYKAWFDVADDLAAGRLRALCTEWTAEASPLYMVVAGRSQLTPLLRGLRDFVAERVERLVARV